MLRLSPCGLTHAHKSRAARAPSPQPLSHKGRGTLAPLLPHGGEELKPFAQVPLEKEWPMLASPHIRDAVEAWNYTLDCTCGSFRARANPALPVFIGAIEHHKQAALEMATLRTNAGQIVHRRRSGDCQDDRYCFLVMQRSGQVQMLHQGRQAFSLRSGELMLLDSVLPCEMVISGVMDHASIYLDRSALQRRLPPDIPLFGKVSARNLCGQMLHGVVQQLLAEEQPPSPAEGQTLQEVMLSLLSQALQGAGSVDRLETVQMQQAARQLIEQQLDHALLTPPALAQQLAISLRQLYRLFEHDGGVCHYIQQRRLARSAQDLQSPQYQHQSITQIAYRWGFTDSAHFSRAFKKQFACAPKEWRSQWV